VSYTDGEALVLTQLRAVNGFTSLNTARADYSILNTGLGAVYGIVTPGQSTHEFITLRTEQSNWQTIVQIWQQYIDDGTTMTDLLANAALIKSRFNAYRKLGDTSGYIIDSMVTAISAPLEMWTKNGNGPAWLRQDITITWQEIQDISFS
jgi:hypothetical protein